MRLARKTGLVLVVLASLAAVVAFVVVALRRIGYPFDLEWIEDTAVFQVNRVLHGQSLYVPPTVHFVPDGYPPLYFYLSAPLAWMTGVSYLPLRLVSFAASLASIAILFRFVSKETSRRVAGVAAVGLFASLYPVTGWWFDLARVDSLFFALCLGGAYLARFANTRRAAAWSGALMALSFLTKQTALVVGILIAAWFVSSRSKRRLAATYTLAFGGIIAVTTALLGVISHGWYVFYVFEVLPHQQVVRGAWFSFWTNDVLVHMWPAITVVLVAVAASVFRRSEVPLGFYAFLATGLLLGSWLSRVHNGGFENVLIPGFGAAILLAAIVAGTVDVKSPHWSAMCVWVLLIVQMGLLTLGKPYSGQIPSAADTESGKILVDFMSRVPGKIYMPSHPYYLMMAHKPPFAHQGAVSDIVRSSGESTAIRELRTSIRKSIEHMEFSLVIVDGPADSIALPLDLDRYYSSCPDFLFEFVPIDVFTPLTDLYNRPHQMLVPRRNGHCPTLPNFASKSGASEHQIRVKSGMP